MGFKVIDNSDIDRKHIAEAGDIVIFNIDKSIYKINTTTDDDYVDLYFDNLNSESGNRITPLRFDRYKELATIEFIKKYLKDDNIRLIKAEDYNLTLEILR